MDDYSQLVSRQRLDMQQLVDGVRAHLTVCLPNGAQFIFTGDCSYREAEQQVRRNPEIGYAYGLGDAEIGAMGLNAKAYRRMQAVMAQMTPTQKAEFIRGVKKKFGSHAAAMIQRRGTDAPIVKAVANVAKGIASSKVFKVATDALAMAAPVLGPLAPAAIAAAGALKGARALFAAKQHKKNGNTAAARKLASYAVDIAEKSAGIVSAPVIHNQAEQSAQKVYALLLQPA